MLYKPTPNIVNNQRETIGANKNATLWVPQCCRANRLTNMIQESNKTSPVRLQTDSHFIRTITWHLVGCHAIAMQ